MLKIYIDAMVLGNQALEQVGKRVRIFSKDQSGATAVEYSLIIALVAIAITVTATALGKDVSRLFDKAGCFVRGGTWNATAFTCNVAAQ
jgi:pilus assembly protein Flp/PilA